MVVIDIKNMILGRVATKIAKQALLGNEIIVINCENAVIAGKRASLLSNYRKRNERGIHTKGPFLPRMPDRFVRRTIRGMLPYKNPRGTDAFKRIMCYSGVPANVKIEEAISYEDCSAKKLPSLKYISVKEICKFLGAKQDD